MRALFATTAFGLEELLKSELEASGAKYCHIAQGSVHFQVDERGMYLSPNSQTKCNKVNPWSYIDKLTVMTA